MSQIWTRNGPILPASGHFWSSSGIPWYVYRDEAEPGRNITGSILARYGISKGEMHPTYMYVLTMLSQKKCWIAACMPSFGGLRWFVYVVRQWPRSWGAHIWPGYHNENIAGPVPCGMVGWQNADEIPWETIPHKWVLCAELRLHHIENLWSQLQVNKLQCCKPEL